MIRNCLILSAALLVMTSASLWAASVPQPLIRPSRITLDRSGTLLIDGLPVFPITLTIIPPPDSQTPDGRHAYEEFRAGGALFMRTGGPKWDEKTLELELEYHKAAAGFGLRCNPWLGWDLSNIPSGNTAAEEQLRKVVNCLKTSPGMGLWKGADEPEWGKKDPAEVANTARIIHASDPDHPIWLVQAPRGTVESLKTYDAGWDIGGIDIYPVSYPPGRHTIGVNKDLTMVGDFTRMMREVAGAKPFWMTLQIAFSGTVPPKGIIRFPTFYDQRFMVYEAIIHGCRGLTFFGGGLLPTLNERDRKLGWNWTYWDRVLKPLLQEFTPGSPSYQALLAPESELKLKISGVKGQRDKEVPDASGVEYLVREVEHEIIIFACKGPGPTIQVRINGLPADTSGGGVLFEEPRVVQVEDDGFSDWFAPYDVHVYRFKANQRQKPE